MIKKIVSIFLIISLIVPNFAFALENSDYTALLLERRVISGDENGLRENEYLLRCEFVKIVNKYYGFNEKADSNFKDVSSDEE